MKLSGWKNFLANILLGMEPNPSVSIHCDCQLAITIAKNKSYNWNNRLILLGQFGKAASKERNKFHWLCQVITNLVDPLTKPLGRNLILEI